MFNPYYNPEKLDLELISFYEDGLSYEYNTLCFWATKDGHVYTASDSGCSCPTPFENYSGDTQRDVIQGLERVENIDHADRLFDSWGCGSVEEKIKLREWFSKYWKA